MATLPSYGLVFAGAFAVYAAFYLIPLWSRGRALHLGGLETLRETLRRDLDREPALDTSVLNPPKRSAREAADEASRLGSPDAAAAMPPAAPVVPQRNARERLVALAALRTDYGTGAVQEAVDQIRAQFPDGAFQRFEIERLPAVAAFGERVGAARTMAGLFVLIGLFFTMVRLNGVVGAIADAAGGAAMAPEQFLTTMGTLMDGIGGAFDSSIAGLGLMVVALVAIGGIDLVAAGRLHRLERTVTHEVLPGLADLRERVMPNLTLGDLLAETATHLATLGTTVRGLTVNLDASLAGLGDRIADMMGDFGSFQHQYARLDDLLSRIGDASTQLRDTMGTLNVAARRIGDPLDAFNKTLLHHLETVADSVAVTRDGFETLGEQVAAVAGQTDTAVGRIEQTATATFGASAAAQQATLADLTRQSADIEAHFQRLAAALHGASAARIDESLGRMESAVDRLAQVEDAPQTLFAWFRDGLARRRRPTAPRLAAAARRPIPPPEQPAAAPSDSIPDPPNAP